MFTIVGDHFIGQSGIAEFNTLAQCVYYSTVVSLSRVACSIFIIISAWFLVEKEFSIKRVFHTWLTVIMYTVPITLIAYLFQLYPVDGNLFKSALLPIENSPLWFANYYIVLILLSPILNKILHDCPKYLIEYYLIIMTLLHVLYVTITADLGYFAHDIWIFIYLYILTGYIKLNAIKLPSVKKAAIIFILSWAMLCLLRGLVAYGINHYGMVLDNVNMLLDVYRARLQSLPNLIMAFSLFAIFYQVKIKYYRMINIIATTVLGIYCFHQVPGWYMWLWNNVFFTKFQAETLLGYNRAGYGLLCIVLIFFTGALIEYIRNKISYSLIESKEWYIVACKNIDSYVNGYVNMQIKEFLNNRKFIVAVLLCIGYFMFVRFIQMYLPLNIG